MIDNITTRFDDKTVIAAFDVFNPKKLPKPIDECYLQYGNTEIERLATQFEGAGVVGDVQQCLEEWSSFRQFLSDSVSESKEAASLESVIADLSSNAFAATVYPNMTAMGKICRVVPIHTADVERTFSQLKIIKTRVRNRMLEKTLDSLLRIAIEGPKLEEFDAKRAVDIWAKKKKRRISRK